MKEFIFPGVIFLLFDTQVKKTTMIIFDGQQRPLQVKSEIIL